MLFFFQFLIVKCPLLFSSVFIVSAQIPPLSLLLMLTHTNAKIFITKFSMYFMNSSDKCQLILMVMLTGPANLFGLYFCKILQYQRTLYTFSVF